MPIINTCDSARVELEKILDLLESEIPSDSKDVEDDFVKALIKNKVIT